MTEVLLLTRETCGACISQRERNDGLEAEFPEVEFLGVDIRTDPETPRSTVSGGRPRHS